MPKKIRAGRTQESSVVKKFWSLPPLNLTPYFSSMAAKFGSTRVVTNWLGSPGWASFRLPMIRLSVIVSSSTLPASRYDWNWLYGRYSVWRVSWNTAWTTRIARIAIITYQALKWLFLSMPRSMHTPPLTGVCPRRPRQAMATAGCAVSDAGYATFRLVGVERWQVRAHGGR